MARENPEKKYEKYKLLNISKETEIEWKEEQLMNYFNQIQTGSNNVPLWVMYNKMYELVISIKSQQSIKIMIDTIKGIFDDLKTNERILISEIINGRKERKQRSGLIYLSYDIGDKLLAKSFAKISLMLLDTELDNENFTSRLDNSKKTCYEIISDLAIEVQ